ncbi:PREDICTED: uncharacterized protein LOC107334108 [Acropora digitifera]|uniref:uncharacterized protein LOC107334108 n=1 Tax=Acropora digitifera TaxID=70779 RepID=UPI00077A23DA|nr:PREDICTED: uncharacterized protein LOC107334108 [Acropora digitifera]
MASSSRQPQEWDVPYFSDKVQVVFLASEWGSSKGGLSTINRKLATQLAKFDDIKVTLFLPECSHENKVEALHHGISIVEAERRPGFEELDWLSFPPEDMQIDVIVGHDVILGRQAQIIRNSHRCKWVLVIHTDPEELGMFKCDENSVSKGAQKHDVVVELCRMADLVVGVGPKLTKAFRKYLSGCKEDQDVFEFTPGVFADFASVTQVPVKRKPYTVLVFGRGDAKHFLLKGYDIAAKSVAALHDTILLFVGAPEGKKRGKLTKRLLKSGIPKRRLRVRGFINSREALKQLFYQVDLVLMPSRTEGYGLTGLEAMSAGLPVIVSKNSGFGETLYSLPLGQLFVIDSEDPKVWTGAIKGILNRDRQEQLELVRNLRDSYVKRYSWSAQCKDLCNKMVNLLVNKEETSTAPDQAMTAINLGEQGRSALLENGDKRSWIQHGETRKTGLRQECVLPSSEKPELGWRSLFHRGPLFSGDLDVQNILHGQLLRESTIDLSGGEEWKVDAERLGFTAAEIRYLELRTMDPYDAVLMRYS